MHCFHCKKEIVVTSKIGRRDTCQFCSSDLHVCKNCDFYDMTAYNECREPSAERVKEKDRSNFCDYFRPGGKGIGAGDDKNKALADLDALFKK